MEDYIANEIANAAIKAMIQTGKIDRADYGKIVQAYNVLADCRAKIDQNLAARLLRTVPGIIESYDERGNYTGACFSESGWLA